MNTHLLLKYLHILSSNENWLLLSYFLFFFTGACWLPVVWLQIQMAKIAKETVETQTELPQDHWESART